MVFDFLRRRKRVSGKDILTYPDTHGFYKRREDWEKSENEDPTEENPNETFLQELSSNLGKSEITWDTLKRLRRQSSQSRSLLRLNKAHNNSDISGSVGFLPQLSTISDVADSDTISECEGQSSTLGKLTKSDIYMSTPSLCQTQSARHTALSTGPRPHSWLDGGGDKFKTHNRSQLHQGQSTASVLKFTRWERHNSLITLQINNSETMTDDLRESEETLEKPGGMSSDNRPWSRRATFNHSSSFSTTEYKNEECLSQVSSHHSLKMESHQAQWRQKDTSIRSFSPNNYVNQREENIFKEDIGFPDNVEERKFSKDECRINSCDEENGDSTDNNDSGLFYDSDSGISSLYECISKNVQLTQDSKRDEFNYRDKIKSVSSEDSQENEDSLDPLSLDDSSIENGYDILRMFLSEINVDRSLHHLFYKSPLGYQSETYGSLVDNLCCEILPPQLFTYDVDLPTHQVAKIISQMKSAVQSRICATQDLVESRLAQLQMQLTQQNDFFSHLDSVLNLNPEVKVRELRLYKTYVVEVDSVVNLIFGLETRINKINCQLNKSEFSEYTLQNLKSLLVNQLDEAKELKARHDIKHATVVQILRQWTNDETVKIFTQNVRDKEVRICATRALKNELFNIKMQLKIIQI